MKLPPAAQPTKPLDAAATPEEMLKTVWAALQTLSDATFRLSIVGTAEAAHEQTERGRQAIKDAQSALSRLEQTKEKQLERTKLSNDFQRASQAFTSRAAEASAKLKNRPGVARASSSSGLLAPSVGGSSNGALGTSLPRHTVSMADYDSQQLQQQQQQQARDEAANELRLAAVVSEVGLNEELIRMRNEELKNIQRTAVTVNGMMKELATMVAEQDHDIKTVASNVAAARDNVDAGLRQVQRAEDYQKNGSECLVS